MKRPKVADVPEARKEPMYTDISKVISYVSAVHKMSHLVEAYHMLDTICLFAFQLSAP